MSARPASRRAATYGGARSPRGRASPPKSTGGGSAVDTSEMIANGTFGASTGWVLGAGWTIAVGVLTATAVVAATTTASTTYVVPLVQGAAYRITYTLSTTTLGSVKFQLTGGATVNGSTRSADGTYTEDVVASAAHTGFLFIAVADYTGNIDNLSVRRVAS